MPKIVKDKCVGCGICANICPEGIEMVNGKARIKNENTDCLKEAASACPRNAIIIENEEKESAGGTRTEFGQVRRAGAGRGGRVAAPGVGGRGSMGGFGAGPSGDCVCLSCGHKAPHQRGIPCYQQKCPQCGSRMTRGR